MDQFSNPPPARRDRRLLPALLAAAVSLLIGYSASSHEIWLETAASGRAGQRQEVCVCWGHAGHRESGERLKSQQSKLNSWFLLPNGQPQDLKLAAKPDCFAATIILTVPGGYAVGAVCRESPV